MKDKIADSFLICSEKLLHSTAENILAISKNVSVEKIRAQCEAEGGVDVDSLEVASAFGLVLSHLVDDESVLKIIKRVGYVMMHMDEVTKRELDRGF